MTIKTKYNIGDTVYILVGAYEVPTPAIIKGIKTETSNWNGPVVLYVFNSPYRTGDDYMMSEIVVFQSEPDAEQYKLSLRS